MVTMDSALRESLTGRLAEYLSALDYGSLPSEVVAALKRLVLDTLGTTLAGNTLGVGCREAVNLALSTRGSPESTLLGLGQKVGASMAAFANGAMSHALNYDASGADAAHLGVSAIAAPLAVAEMIGGVTGKEFLCGVAAGTELTARLASSVASPGKENPNVLKGQVLGYFGAAAAAGRILKLTPGEMHSALGLALMQAAGTMQVVFDGDPPAKAIYGAFPNQAGVMSVLLSRQGIGAEIDVFEGRAGIFGMYYPGAGEPARLTRNLGDEFFMSKMRFKPWPTSGVLHPFIAAALRLRSSKNLRADGIREVVIRGGDHLRPFCEPIEERRRSRNAAAAANSAFFAVAKALVNGKISLGDFAPDGLKQSEVGHLTDRIRCAIEPERGRSGAVEITTVAKEKHIAEFGAGGTGSEGEMSYSQLLDKFADCANYAARSIRRDTLDQVVDAIEHLERLPDVAEIPNLLGNGS